MYLQFELYQIKNPYLYDLQTISAALPRYVSVNFTITNPFIIKQILRFCKIYLFYSFIKPQLRFLAIPSNILA
jgi:hypothetical protein